MYFVINSNCKTKKTQIEVSTSILPVQPIQQHFMPYFVGFQKRTLSNNSEPENIIKNPSFLGIFFRKDFHNFVNVFMKDLRILMKKRDTQTVSFLLN